MEIVVVVVGIAADNKPHVICREEGPFKRYLYKVPNNIIRVILCKSIIIGKPLQMYKV